MKQNCVDLEYKKYPAQMLEVAGDLRRAPAKFENPAVWCISIEQFVATFLKLWIAALFIGYQGYAV